MNSLLLYHGSEAVIEKPAFSFHNHWNDYGKGFYCTDQPELGREWACRHEKDGFLNCYKIERKGLKTLDLSDSKHNVLNWIAILLQNRQFRINAPLSVEARDYLIKEFAPDLNGYDIVVGYRADDSYFQYAQAFVENTLSIRSLNKALRLGELGFQTVLISGRAFEAMEFISADPVERDIYYPKFAERDLAARKAYKKLVSTEQLMRDDIYVLDIIREGMSADDERIQRNLCE